MYANTLYNHILQINNKTDKYNIMNEQNINEYNTIMEWWNNLSVAGVNAYLDKYGEQIGYYGSTEDFWKLNKLSPQFIVELFRAVQTKN